MGLLSSLTSTRQRLESPAVPISSAAVLEAIGLEAPTAAGIRVSRQAALGITAYWAGVRILAETVAQLPIDIVERAGPRRIKHPDHPVAQLLREPNPLMNGQTLVEQVMVHLLTDGNWFAELEQTGAGQVRRLWPLVPDATEVAVREDGQTPAKVYRTSVDHKPVTLRADQVVHVPALGYDGLRGYNPIRLHREALGLTIATSRYGASFFGNAARPSGVLKHPGNPDKDARREIRTEWEQMHSGLSNAQRVAVLWGGMEWQQMSINPDDAQFLSTRVLQVEEVARILNVPTILLHHSQGATTWGTAIGQFLTAFGKFSVMPWVGRIEAAWNLALFAADEIGRFVVKFDPGGLLRGDLEMQNKILEIERRNGILNGDEWRALLDRDPLPAGQGQAYLVPLNMVPVGDLSQSLDGPRDRRTAPGPTGRRSALARRRLRDAHRRLFREACARWVKRETDAIQRVVKAVEAKGGALDRELETWIRDFFDGQRAAIQRVMLPCVLALAEATTLEAAEEVGVDVGNRAVRAARQIEMDDILGWATAYVATFALRETSSSIGQWRTLLAETAPALLVGAITTRAQEWLDGRAEKVADNEVVRVSSGAARFAWRQSGISTMTWRANPGACPLCQQMDGKTVTVTGTFLAPGDAVNAGEGISALIVSEPVGGPPLHRGCQCELVPGGR